MKYSKNQMKKMFEWGFEHASGGENFHERMKSIEKERLLTNLKEVIKSLLEKEFENNAEIVLLTMKKDNRFVFGHVDFYQNHKFAEAAKHCLGFVYVQNKIILSLNSNYLGISDTDADTFIGIIDTVIEKEQSEVKFQF